jgi:radial spoke head protein 4A
LTGDWTELPDVKPSQIRAARKIRYVFTGDLTRKIVTNPHFPGDEKELLRCQISRIYHGTKVEPSVNHWVVPDAENPFKPLEKNSDESKVKPMKLNELLSMSNWIHFPPVILNQGRVSHYIEYPEEVNQEEYKAKIVQKDPFGSRIKPISEDVNLVSSIPNIKLPSWRIQYMYDDKIYTNPNIKMPEKTEGEELEQKDNTTNYLVICLRSLRWPGAYTVKFKNEMHSFYFGWGQKFADYTMGEKFVYQDFPIIPREINDFEDFPEPNSPPHEENVEKVEDS